VHLLLDDLLTCGTAVYASSQVAESFNQLITAMGGISNVDDTIRRLDILVTSTRHDLDALIDKSKGFTLQKDFSAFQERTFDAETQVTTAIKAIHERLTSLEMLVPRVDDHEVRIMQIETALKAHAQLLGTHGEILQEHRERLHTREEVADQHAVSILELKEQSRRHAQSFLDVQKQLEQRQRTRDALVASMDEQFAEVTARFEKDAQILDTYKDSVTNRLAMERKQTLGDISALEKRVGARTDAIRKEVQDNEAQAVARVQNLEGFLNIEVERVEKTFNDKWTKLGNDVDRQNRILRKTIDDNLSMLQKTVAESQEGANSNLRNAKQELLIGQKAFEVEVNKKVDVFRDTIKSIGPEIEDIVRRETFDMMKEHMDEHSRKLQMLIDAKVGQDIIKQELAKKADVLSLGAYTKKADADALVSNAMGEHAKQVEIFLMNTILDNPTKAGVGGGSEAEGGREAGHEEKTKVLELENYNLKHGECINELYQMVKDLHAIVEKDTKSLHYKALRAKPSNYLSARTLTPVTNAHGASQGLPHYVNQLALPDKLTPRSGGSVQNSARSALQGWGVSNSDRSHYSGVLGADANGASTSGEGGETGRSDKIVSFAAGHATRAGGLDGSESNLTAKKEVAAASPTSGEGQNGPNASPSDMLVLDLIEEELQAKGVPVGGAPDNASRAAPEDGPDTETMLLDLPANIYESNSPQVAFLCALPYQVPKNVA
jgi:hypothetical protein